MGPQCVVEVPLAAVLVTKLCTSTTAILVTKLRASTSAAVASLPVTTLSTSETCFYAECAVATTSLILATTGLILATLGITAKPACLHAKHSTTAYKLN